MGLAAYDVSDWGFFRFMGEDSKEFLQGLLTADPPEEAELLGAAEFEKIRVASGFPWYGIDMDAASLPLEARQEAAISLDKVSSSAGDLSLAMVKLDASAPGVVVTVGSLQATTIEFPSWPASLKR